MILFCINGEASPAQPRRATERCRSPTGRAAPAPPPHKLRGAARGAAPAPPPAHSGTAPPAPGPPEFPVAGNGGGGGRRLVPLGLVAGSEGGCAAAGDSARRPRGSTPTGRAALRPAESWAGAEAHLRSRIPHTHTLPGCPSCRPARCERLCFLSVVFVRGSWPVWGQGFGWFLSVSCS